MTTTDRLHMARALALAERGRGRTSPNPMVGATVVDAEGVVVGRGSHQVAGGPHAEVYALAEAGDRARGATLYCTLEPCCHTGRTGPCAPLVVRSGIRRAVIAVEDPNPLVAGKGLLHLRDQGVDVEVGVMGEEAARLNAPFFTAVQHGRPFVTMKAALSRDRAVAAGTGSRTHLTGAEANRWIHRERAEIDAIAVGSATVLVDDPLLTARGAYRARPLTRVVFDRSLRIPPGARLLSTADAGPIILVSARTGDGEIHRRGAALEAAGAHIEWVEAPEEQHLRATLDALARRGIQSLVVEGGPTLHAAFWRAGLIDRVEVFLTPKVLGPDALAWLTADVLDPPAGPGWNEATRLRLGEDEMIEGYVHRAD